MHLTTFICCTLLTLAAAAFGFLGFLLGGGDSAFAQRSGWVYSPYLAAVLMSIAACAATFSRQINVAIGLIALAVLAYTVTWYS